jgi:hypothetical protein
MTTTNIRELWQSLDQLDLGRIVEALARYESDLFETADAAHDAGYLDDSRANAAELEAVRGLRLEMMNR